MHDDMGKKKRKQNSAGVLSPADQRKATISVLNLQMPLAQGMGKTEDDEDLTVAQPVPMFLQDPNEPSPDNKPNKKRRNRNMDPEV